MKKDTQMIHIELQYLVNIDCVQEVSVTQAVSDHYKAPKTLESSHHFKAFG